MFDFSGYGEFRHYPTLAGRNGLSIGACIASVRRLHTLGLESMLYFYKPSGQRSLIPFSFAASRIHFVIVDGSCCFNPFCVSQPWKYSPALLALAKSVRLFSHSRRTFFLAIYVS